MARGSASAVCVRGPGGGARPAGGGAGGGGAGPGAGHRGGGRERRRQDPAPAGVRRPWPPNEGRRSCSVGASTAATPGRPTGRSSKPSVPVSPRSSPRSGARASDRAALLRGRCSTGWRRPGGAPPSCCCSTTCTGPTGRPATSSGSSWPTWPASRGRWWSRRCAAKLSCRAIRSCPCWPSCGAAGGPSSSPLDRLGKGEVAAQLASILGQAPEPELLEEIWRRSEGNPFFVEELLVAARSGQELTIDAAADPRRSARRPSPPPPSRPPVRCAAAVGPVPHRILAEVAGMPEPALLAGLRECVGPPRPRRRPPGRHLHVPPQPAAGSRLRRPPARRGHPPPRRLRAGPRGRPGHSGGGRRSGAAVADLAAMAWHLYAAGDAEQALPAALAAAAAAEAACGYAEAHVQYERALELADGLPAEALPARDSIEWGWRSGRRRRRSWRGSPPGPSSCSRSRWRPEPPEDAITAAARPRAGPLGRPVTARRPRRLRRGRPAS